jgi:hypothetical protein
MKGAVSKDAALFLCSRKGAGLYSKARSRFGEGRQRTQRSIWNTNANDLGVPGVTTKYQNPTISFFAFTAALRAAISN